MIFPDQSHINRVREALWRSPKGCASVMIGAGFSRNARKEKPNVNDFPMWSDIVKLLCEKLYPQIDENQYKQVMADVSGISGFLRLAQEYEAAFGRKALHDFIQEIVPDENFVPDDIHIQLLSLPWRDVFTTNWDTLLERALPLVLNRAYRVIRTPDEIPASAKPRIIKLHGSFPAHIPYIFTEEDYRTYPKKFAAYVNTVQQAMMETVFLLIGFSGDDPNFLHWSGWVRDNLGISAPKIYLAGWLNLSPHRRRMLEDRNVVPIDVARHPKADSWADHLRHEHATKWILHTLELGRPYDLIGWPTPYQLEGPLIQDNLQPIEPVKINTPLEEPSPPSFNAEQDEALNEVRNIVSIWKHNRNIYPGWITPPPKKKIIMDFMLDWERRITRYISEFSTIEQLKIMREFVWRFELFLYPLSKQVEEIIDSILLKIDCQNRKIDGVEDRNLDWVEIRECWRELALTLLTIARQRFDNKAFEDRLIALKSFTGDHSDVAQRVHHERCLFALYSLDFPSLEQLLDKWKTEACDPIWMTRKAAILVEIGFHDEAVRLLNQCLSILRETTIGANIIASSSREGWSLWMALAFQKPFDRVSNIEVSAPPASSRWKELSALDCDSFSQLQEFKNGLQDRPENEDSPLFDLGRRKGRSITYHRIGDSLEYAARRAIRLCEVAGLPPLVSRMGVASGLLRGAADILAKKDFATASRLILRLLPYDDDKNFNRIWSRSRIASLSMQEVDNLVNLVENAIKYSWPKVNSGGKNHSNWLGLLSIAIEAFSRLTLRLPPERIEIVFKQALSYFRKEEFNNYNRWLHKSKYHLLSRTWEAMPNILRNNYFLEVMSLPIIGLDESKKDIPIWKDPVGILSDTDELNVPERTQETEEKWAEIIKLIVLGLQHGGHARERAAFRPFLDVFMGAHYSRGKKATGSEPLALRFY